MKYLKILAVIILLSSCSMQTFYVVRHAEKDGSTDEAGLTAAGIERAVALEKYLSDKKLDTVFTSNIRRTILTGLSVALPQSIPQVPLKQSPQEELNNFIGRLKNIHSNKNILVVGHSNTVAVIVQALSGQQIPAIAETVYNNLYIVTVKGKDVTLVHTTYGR